MKTLIRSIAAAAYLLCAASAVPAYADGDARDFTMHNDIGSPITHLYISEHSNDNWETDVLGKDVLADGDETKITFSGYAEDVCDFDIKITVDNDTSWIVDDVDLCKTQDIKFSKDGDKVVYEQA